MPPKVTDRYAEVHRHLWRRFIVLPQNKEASADTKDRQQLI